MRILVFLIAALVLRPLSGSCAEITSNNRPEKPIAGRAIPGVRYLQADPATGGAKAVIVHDQPLIHTAQLLPDASTNLEHQIALLLDAQLPAVLKRAGSDLGQVVKLNFYVSAPDVVPAIEHALASHFDASRRPAVSFVATAFPGLKARVALDAIAVAPEQNSNGVRYIPENEAIAPKGFSSAAILPSGPKLYLSGMADTNALHEGAVLKTLTKMMAAINQLGLGKADIVQFKAFVQPMTDVEFVKRQISQFLEGPTPPLVFVGWSSPPPNPPIEIELIAAAKPDAAYGTNTVTFLTPAGTTDSKVFRRVARVDHGSLIYLSALYGGAVATPGDQAQSIFDQLGDVTKQAGSDFEHLVKATYYHSDDSAGAKINEVRPRFFKPGRPPAASKAKVAGVGLAGRTMTVDMIAVTRD